MIDRILFKLDELVRPFVHKILVVIEPLLIDEDYYARVEGREIIANLSKAAGLATMIAAMRPDIDNIDECALPSFAAKLQQGDWSWSASTLGRMRCNAASSSEQSTAHLAQPGYHAEPSGKQAPACSQLRPQSSKPHLHKAASRICMPQSWACTHTNCLMCRYVRNTTARAFSVVASALGIPALLPFLKAVCMSKKSWQARHTGIKIVQQISILLGCAILPHLKVGRPTFPALPLWTVSQ